MAGIRTFTEKQKLTFQRKLANFLRSFRAKNQLLSKEVAALLDYDPPRYSKLEHPSVPFDRFIGALEFLYTIISVDPEMTLAEFAHKLEGTSNRSHRKLQNWELKILKVFDGVSIPVIDAFVRLANKSYTQGHERMNERLQSMLKLLEAVQGLAPEEIDNLRSALLAVKSQK